MLYVLCGYQIHTRSHPLTPWLLLGEIGIPVVTGFTPRAPQKLSPPYRIPLSFPSFRLLSPPKTKDHRPWLLLLFTSSWQSGVSRILLWTGFPS